MHAYFTPMPDSPTFDYANFLASKVPVVGNVGLEVDPSAVNPKAFDFQRDIVRWLVRKGRAGCFADCGMGKSFMSIEWARLLDQPTLILTPLAVAQQFVTEGAKFDTPIQYARQQREVGEKIVVTNYEMLDKFDVSKFGAVVLDESAILRDFEGKTRTKLIQAFREVPYRLSATATPAPNDHTEIANHAEFLGVMTRTEVLATFFVHDDQGWRLKGHAREAFYRWMASWAITLRKPSDLGYSDEGFTLPPLEIRAEYVESEYKPSDQLFFTGMKGITDRTKIRKGTANDRVFRLAQIINRDPEHQWIVWCGLNDEAKSLFRLVPGSVDIEGSDPRETKIEKIGLFLSGDARVLISKPSIAGHGLNLQHCHKMAFLGLGDSWEAYYQGIRREWRFGQKEPVEVVIVLADIEDQIYQNVLRKEREADQLMSEVVANVRDFERAELGRADVARVDYRTDEASGENWRLLLGDSVERLREIPDQSIDLSVYSPPFVSLMVYSASPRDLGNARSECEFFTHYQYIMAEVLRVTKPGRISAVHVADVPAMLARDGYIGLKDFSGDVIRAHIAAGWIFDSRIPIDKNQQAQSIRTHAKGLTMTQMEKDRTWSRPALPDYILKFRKSGENAVPVAGGDITRDLWIEYANPTWPNEQDRCLEAGAFATWYGIHESDTLNVAEARSEKDERHICPLQLATIERIIKLWSNRGETILTPFAGIGSEVYQAVMFGRKAIGIELKPEYFRVAVTNLRRLEHEQHVPSLLDLIGDSARGPA